MATVGTQLDFAQTAAPAEAPAAPLTAPVSHNSAHALVLLAALGLAAGFSAYLLTGIAGVALVALIIIGLALAAPNVPAETMMRLYSARRMPADDTQLTSLMDVLAWRAGLPQTPALYLIPSLTPNAFATGTAERPAIAISEGLVRRLSMRELAGVIAHEMSHIRNGDLWIMGLADVAARVSHAMAIAALMLLAYNFLAYPTGAAMVSWLAIAALYVSPAALNLLQLALSRAREFEADRLAVALTGDPIGLASALNRVDIPTGHVWEDLTPPIAARRVPLPSLLRTHPPAGARVARLQDLAETHGPAPLVIVEKPYMSLVGMGPATLRPRYRFPGLWY
jgi:heat shock protein HtpX